jgi:hypothetical protein
MMIGQILLKKEIRRKEEKGSSRRTRSKTDKNKFSIGSTATAATEISTDLSSSSLPNSLNRNEPTVVRELQKTNLDGDFSTDKILDQAKENVERSAVEAKNEIIRYTDSIRLYQEQNIKYAQEIAENYINTQKEVINLLKSWWLPFWQNASQSFVFPLISPQGMIETYANIASSLAGNTLRITRLVNDAMLVNLEFFKATIEHTKGASDDLARACANMVKKIERESPDIRAQYTT